MTMPGGDARRDLVFLCVLMGAAFVAQTMLLLAVPLRALELGAGPALVGALVSAPFWLPTILAIPLGRLISRVGPRPMITIGATILTLGPWLAVVLDGVLGLLATQLVVGLALISMGLSAQSVISTMGRGRQLEKRFGWYTTCVSVGQLLGPLTAGFVIEGLGTGAVFPIAGTLPVVSLVCARLLSSEAGRIVSARATSERPGAGAPMSGVSLGYRDQIALLRTNPAVQLSLIVTVAMMFAIGAHSAFFPVYLESLAIPAGLIGVLLSLRGLCSTAVRPFMAWLIEHLGGRFRTFATCLLLAAVGLAFTGTVESWFPLAFLAALIGIGTGLALPLSMVTIADHVEAEDRPAALGMRLTTNQAAQVAGPAVLGLVAEFAGYTGTFVVGGFVLVLLLGVLWRMKPAYTVWATGAGTD